MPVYPDFKPLVSAWDDITDRAREFGVDVYGFIRAMGPVPESSVLEAWSILKHLRASDKDIDEEGAIQVRRFMDEAEVRYSGIVLFAHGPSMPVWTVGALDTDAAKKTSIVRMPSGEFFGFADPRFHRRVFRALCLPEDKRVVL